MSVSSTTSLGLSPEVEGRLAPLQAQEHARALRMCPCSSLPVVSHAALVAARGADPSTVDRLGLAYVLLLHGSGGGSESERHEALQHIEALLDVLVDERDVLVVHVDRATPTDERLAIERLVAQRRPPNIPPLIRVEEPSSVAAMTSQSLPSVTPSAGRIQRLRSDERPRRRFRAAAVLAPSESFAAPRFSTSLAAATLTAIRAVALAADRHPQEWGGWEFLAVMSQSHWPLTRSRQELAQALAAASRAVGSPIVGPESSDAGTWGPSFIRCDLRSNPSTTTGVAAERVARSERLVERFAAVIEDSLAPESLELAAAAAGTAMWRTTSATRGGGGRLPLPRQLARGGPEDLPVCEGSQWGVLHRAVARWAAESPASERLLVGAVAGAHVPDELLLPTLALASPAGRKGLVVRSATTLVVNHPGCGKGRGHPCTLALLDSSDPASRTRGSGKESLAAEVVRRAVSAAQLSIWDRCIPANDHDHDDEEEEEDQGRAAQCDGDSSGVAALWLWGRKVNVASAGGRGLAVALGHMLQA